MYDPGLDLIVGTFFSVWTLVVVGLVSMSFQKSVSGPINASENATVTDTLCVQANPNVLAAQPAVLTVRTDTVTGSLTMANANHGIITGQRIDLYWTGGQCYGATVGTVAGLVVPFATVSGGSVLPAASTSISVGIPVQTPFNVTGNNVTALALSMGSGQNGYFIFNNGATDVYAALVTGGYLSGWKTGDPQANPLAGTTPTKVWISHNNQTGAVASAQVAALTH